MTVLLALYIVMVLLFIPCLHISRKRHAHSLAVQTVVKLHNDEDELPLEPVRVKLKGHHWPMVLVGSFIIPAVLGLLFLIVVMVMSLVVVLLGVILTLVAIALVLSPIWLSSALGQIGDFRKWLEDIKDA